MIMFFKISQCEYLNYEEMLVSVFQTFQNQPTASPSYFKTIFKELVVFNLRTSKEQVVQPDRV
jgi:hypothetical protein